MQISKTQTSGFSLLEVLVASLLVSGVLVSAMYSELLFMRHAKQANLTTMAVTLAANLAEQLKLAHSPTNQTSIVTAWQRSLEHYLPNPTGSLSCNTKQCHIKVSFNTQEIHFIQLTIDPREINHE